jgi:hypothetical protein
VNRAIGYTITNYWCRKCVPEGVVDSYPPMREGDDHGVPYHCDLCDEPLLPCDHVWEDDWHRAYTQKGRPPRDIRFCKVPDCGDVEYRDAEHCAADERRKEVSGD